MSMFQKETPYKAPTFTEKEKLEDYAKPTEPLLIASEGWAGLPPNEEVLTTSPAPLSIDSLFAKQDALRDRFKRLKKFIVEEVPASKDKSEGLVKLDEALASLVVGITKEMK